MTAAASRLHHVRTPFDDRRSIAISLYMTLVGYGVLVALPAISAARVALLGFSEEQVGRLSSADLGGLAAGAALGAALIAKGNRRRLVWLGALTVIFANVLCLRYQQYPITLLLRLLAGLGSGLYTSVAVAILGATARPAQAYNRMLFAFAFSQALELQVLPHLSMNGIYAGFIAAYALGLAGLNWMPAHAADRQLDVAVDVENGEDLRVEHRRVPAYLVWLCLLAILLTYTNIGGYWTYIELAARSAGVAPDWISRLLVWGSLAGILGCLLATRISNRFGLARPLLAALMIMAAAVGLLGLGMNTASVTLSLLAFNWLWIFIDVYQMGFIANADHSGRYSSLIPAAQGLGQIFGPNIAASLLAGGADYAAVFGVCALFALLAWLTYLATYFRLRRLIPELADAA